MPRTEEQNEKIKLQRKAQIMEVALEEFAHNGFHKTSMSTIAKKCDLSKGSLYNYFDSKDHLLQSLIDQAMGEGGEVMQVMDDNEKTSFEKLKHACELAFDMVEQSPEYWRFILMLSLQRDIIDQVKDKVLENNEMTLQKTEELLRELGAEQPEKEAYLLGALLDGILLHECSMSDEYPIHEMRSYFFDFLKSRYQ
jgi:AcrR family transcriptional regulator